MLRPARVYLSFYIVLILVLLVSGLSLMPNLRYRLTRNERKYLAGISVLRAVGDNSFPPFSYTSGGVPAGYEADLVKVLQNFIGVEIVLEQHLWTGVRQMLESGQADFVTGMRITPERLSTYAFSGPYLITSHALIMPHGSTVASLKELGGLRIVAQAGSSTYERLVGKGLEVIPVTDPEAAYSLLTQGLADAWVEQEWVARYYIGSKDMHQWSVRSLPDTRGEYALAFSSTADPRLISIVNKALQKLRYEGLLAELDTRWFGPAMQEIVDMRQQHSRILFLIIGIATLGLGLVLSNTYLQHRINYQTKALFHANAQLSDQQEKLQQMLLNAAKAFGRAIEVKDIYTGGHSQRVARVAYAISKEMGFNEKECFILCLGALMHDIGKVGVPDHILAKVERLTPEEFKFIRSHPQIGDDILRNVEGYDKVREIVLFHHERWDGKTDKMFPAYPGVKSGEDIPLGARIVAVADAFDAMTSNRPYRQARSMEEALAVLEECQGAQFDPRVVTAALRALGKTLDINDLPQTHVLWSIMGNRVEL